MKNWIFALISLMLVSCKQKSESLNVYRGQAQGSTYSIKIIGDGTNLEMQEQIDSIITAVDVSMSTYQSNSLISRLNEGDSSVVLDQMFIRVMNRSMEIAKETNGLFDPTVGPLVELWGFGSKKPSAVDSIEVDSVKQIIGYSKVNYSSSKVYLPPGYRIDFNAIAQGYTVDLLAEFIGRSGFENYMVELGGELRVSGLNSKGEKWKIGLDKPQEEIDNQDRFQLILALKDIAMATSGNYRKFWVDEVTGEKYVHTINPITGFTAKNRLLSTTILSKTTMDADAYATTCMVMGLDQALPFIESKENTEAYFIYSDTVGNWKVAMTEGFASYISSK